MEKFSNDYAENVRVLDDLLGVERSCDMVSRDYLIGGRRARLWVVDGFGSDSIIERMGAFWLTPFLRRQIPNLRIFLHTHGIAAM